MESWEKALNIFLDKIKKKNKIIGVLVCGSFITGNPTKHSDIDVHLILPDNSKYRERGNKIVNGYLIEYFMNPKDEIIKYFKSDFNGRKKASFHMFLTGKILFDEEGKLKELKKEAKKYFQKRFKKPNKNLIESSKYALWDMLDNLEEVLEYKRDDFEYVYFNFLNNILSYYSQYLKFEEIPINKIRRFLTVKKDKKKYFVDDFPDKKFQKLFLNCFKITEREKMFKDYTILTNYVISKMGGFNIDGWKLRLKLENN